MQSVGPFNVGTTITGEPVDTAAVVSLVVFRELGQAQPFLQPLRQLNGGRSFTIVHPRMTTVAAVDMLLQKLREA